MSTLNKLHSFTFLFIFLSAYPQGAPKVEKGKEVVHRSLKSCKTWEDTLSFYKVNARVNLAIANRRLKAYRDTTKKQGPPAAIRRDSAILVDTIKK